MLVVYFKDRKFKAIARDNHNGYPFVSIKSHSFTCQGEGEELWLLMSLPTIGGSFGAHTS